MDTRQLKQLISTTLKEIGLHSQEVELLLLRTAAVESDMGEFIKQVGGGPALGIMQMEPTTFYDHINWLSTRKKELYMKILEVCGIGTLAVEMHNLRGDKRVPRFVKEMIPSRFSSILYPEMMMYNLKFAICMARVQYLRAPGKIPKTFDAQWDYYKVYFNSVKGATTYDKFKAACQKFKL